MLCCEISGGPMQRLSPLHLPASRRSASNSLLATFLGKVGECLLLCAAVTIPAFAQTATTTSLAITSGGSAVTSVVPGTAVTLTATVAGSAPVTRGLVKFCDATATYCEDTHLLGTAQLPSTGTAVLTLRPAVGSHSYKAVFAGTKTNATSSSA